MTEQIVMLGKQFNSVMEVVRAFPDNRSCIDYLEKIRWEGKPISPFDESSKVYKCKDGKYKCKTTGKYFNVLTGTTMEGTKLELQKWMVAVWLVINSKKGVTSYQLMREVHITQKTAWFMLHRIRLILGKAYENSKLDGIVEIDETFVGGANKNRHKDKKEKNCQGRSCVRKTPILGMLQRDGLLILKVMKSTAQEDITPLVLQYVDRSATIYTDEWEGYNEVRRIYRHDFVKHRIKQYANGDVTTNGIENRWSHLKRGIMGVNHQVTRRHLQLYADEFSFKMNVRKMSQTEQFQLVFASMGQRLTYKQLIEKNYD